MGELYEVVTYDGETMDAIMEERSPETAYGWINGRVFCIPQDRVNEVINGLFARRFGGYRPSDVEHGKIRKAILMQLVNCDEETVAFNTKIADLFSLGKYDFSGTCTDANEH